MGPHACGFLRPKLVHKAVPTSRKLINAWMSSGIRIVTSVQTTVCTVVVWGPDVVLTVHLAQQFTNVWTSVCLPPLFA